MSDVKGLDSLKRKFDKLEITDAEAGEWSLEMAEIVAEFARQYVPVDTGELQDSIEAVQDGMGAHVEAGTDHALPIEFGTSRMAAQPFMRPAVSRARGELLEVSKKNMDKKVRSAV